MKKSHLSSGLSGESTQGTKNMQAYTKEMNSSKQQQKKSAKSILTMGNQTIQGSCQ
jgi:hypothetical protein